MYDDIFMLQPSMESFGPEGWSPPRLSSSTVVSSLDPSQCTLGNIEAASLYSPFVLVVDTMVRLDRL